MHLTLYSLAVHNPMLDYRHLSGCYADQQEAHCHEERTKYAVPFLISPCALG